MKCTSKIQIFVDIFKSLLKQTKLLKFKQPCNQKEFITIKKSTDLKTDVRGTEEVEEIISEKTVATVKSKDTEQTLRKWLEGNTAVTL